jgi:hypothetical protein
VNSVEPTIVNGQLELPQAYANARILAPSINLGLHPGAMTIVAHVWA